MTNIVLIVADALSAFHLPCYGYDRDTAPFLTELAEDNTFYRYAYANAPWTLPSHASLFTGDLPSEHGCTTENIYFEADSVVEDLQEEYTTVGFSNNPLLASQGFDRGFDEFAGGKVIPLAYHGYDAFETVLRREQDGQYDGKQEKYTDFLQEVVRQRDLGSLAAAARFLYRTKLRGDDRFSFLTDSGAAATNHLVQEELEDVDGDFFLFINYMEPHEPYSPPDDLKGRWVDQVGGAEQWYREQGFLAKPDNIDTSIPADMQDAIRGFYDAEVHHLDRKIRELHEYITGEFDDTVFIITADHGENLNHNDLFGHHYGAWERLLRVPLIVAGEHIPDRTIDEPVPLQNIPGLLRGETGPEG
ncbi:MAG: sulfatase-like hydrolase/transferase, partial [Candidatus Nanohaloarchaea archaeon]|nr:sulfatase-like hydrolase/transferase [Candidatus Nanohaloarchaea archaeon]